MAWLVFLFSGALFLAGASAIGFGVEFIDIERGWTQVIAGSVAVTGAVMTFALGCILVRLGGLQRSMSAASRETVAEPAPAVYTPPQPGYEAGETETQHDEPQPDLSAVAVASVDAEIANVIAEQAAILPSGEEETRPQSSATEAAVAPARDESEPAAVDPAGDAAPPAAKQKNNRANGLSRLGKGWPFTRAARAVAIEPPPPLPETAAAGASEPAYSVDWLESALTKLEDEAEWATPKEPAEPAEVHVEVPGSLEPSPSADETADSPKAAAPAEQNPEIVGKYSAGGVSYSIFVDGSIEADTPNGVYKFLSMEELKAFIDARGAVSPTA
jgi:hypothetical protein